MGLVRLKGGGILPQTHHLTVNDMTEYTLITGASRGIGAAFARRLAAAGNALILTARDGDALEALRQELASRHAIPVHTLIEDLTRPAAAHALHAECSRRQWRVTRLINNAGFGRFGDFPSHTVEDYESMIRLNTLAPVELTHLFLPEMRARGHGAIINVASTAAFQPTPYLAVYGATKAFLLSFSEALAAECAGSGVQVLAVCPGATRTEFFGAAGRPDFATSTPAPMQSAEAVVDEALRALSRSRHRVVTGKTNRLMLLASRLLPGGLKLKLSMRVMQRWLGPAA